MSRIMIVGAWASVSVSDIQDGYEEGFKATGHEVYTYKLCERVAEAERDLTRKWQRSAKEQGFPKPNEADIAYYAGVPLLERYMWFRPDWVIAVSGKWLHPQVIVWLRQMGARVAVLLTESPYETENGEDKFIQFVNLAWTNERSVVPYLRKFNPHTYYLPHAHDPAKHKPDDDGIADVPSHDVVFVGTGFQERMDILNAVDWTGIDLGLYGTWPLMGSRANLRQYIRGGIVENKGAASLYRRSKIGLNLYRTSKQLNPKGGRIDGAESLNPRALELAACGVFQISDYRREVEEVFGASVLTFERPDALEETIRAYLAHPELRANAAARARYAVQARTYAVNATQMIADLTAYEEELCRRQPVLSSSS